MLFFGNKQQQFIPTEYKNSTPETVLNCSPFDSLVSIAPIKQLVFLHQVHGIDGIVVHDYHQTLSLLCFKHEGDFLITNVPLMGLAVATADCLPIIFYDDINHVVAIAHAGWRGSVNGIALRVLQRLQQEYSTKLDQLKIFFGPYAKNCCYQVGQEFRDLIAPIVNGQVFTQKNGAFFFDLGMYNRLVMKGAGVPESSFSFDYVQCTICTLYFCSVRAQPGTLFRQLSMVSLLPF